MILDNNFNEWELDENDNFCNPNLSNEEGVFVNNLDHLQPKHSLEEINPIDPKYTEPGLGLDPKPTDPKNTEPVLGLDPKHTDTEPKEALITEKEEKSIIIPILLVLGLGWLLLRKSK